MAFSSAVKLEENKIELQKVTADLETAISLTGYGKYHNFVIFVGGLCFLALGFEYGLNAYVIPASQCDLQMSSKQMGLLNALFLGGGIVSCFVWGVMADTCGRKKVLVVALAADALVTMSASLSPNYILFAVLRFISGFLCGAPGSLVNSYVAEFCSDKHRARGICIIGFFWTLSWMLAPALAWAIVPIKWTFELPFVSFNSWRIFAAMIGLPNLIAALMLAYCLPETPKFLFTQGNEKEAIEVLKKMFEANTGSHRDNYPVTKLVSSFTQSGLSCSPLARKVRRDHSILYLSSIMGEQVKQIVTPPFMSKTLLCASIYFTNMFGYYGIGLWLPELFNRFEEHYSAHPNVTVTVCELARLRTDNTANVTFQMSAMDNITEIINDCSHKTVNLSVFSNTLIIGAICCWGNIFAACVSNKVGGRILSIICMVTAGLCGIAIYFSRTSLENLIINCVFMTCIGTGLTVISSCVVNLFPTSIRGMGVCMGIFFGRVGAVTSNLVFGMLLDISCEVPILLLGGTVILGGFLCILLPKDSEKAAE